MMGIAKIIKNHFSRSAKQPSTTTCEDKKVSLSPRRLSLSPIRSNTKSPSSKQDFENSENWTWREERREPHEDESFEESRCFSPEQPFLAMKKRVRFDVHSDAVSHISEITIYEDSTPSTEEQYDQGFNKKPMSAAQFKRYGTFRRPIKIYHTDSEDNESADQETRGEDKAQIRTDTQQDASFYYTGRTLPKLPISPLNRRRSYDRFSDTVSRISEMTIYEDSVRSNDYDEINEDFTEIQNDQIAVAPSIIFVRARNRRCQRCYKTITKKVIFV